MVVEVTHFGAGIERRLHRHGVTRKRNIQHCDFVAGGGLHACDQINIALDAGDQFSGLRLFEPQLMQRADAIRVAVKNIIE